MDKDFANKLTAFLAFLIGMFAFLSQIFPQLQEGIDKIGAVLIVIVPAEYQSTVQMFLIAIAVVVAIIVFAFNYTTSTALAEEKYAQGLKLPPPEEDPEIDEQ
jgi:hypothetical protein